MGLLGSLFGGSKTTVTQTAKNTTNVDVGVDVMVDLSDVAKALDRLDAAFVATGEKTTDVIKSLSEGQKIEVLAILADVQEKMKQNELLAKGVTYLKYAALGAAGLWLLKGFFK